MHGRNAGATYITAGRRTSAGGREGVKWLLSVVAAVLALLVLFSSSGFDPVAFADEADDSKAAQENANELLGKLDPGIPKDEQNSSYLFNQVNSYDGDREVTTFQGVLWSIFGIRYINNIRHANVPSSTRDTANRLGLGNPGSAVYACNTEQVGHGTAYYHNCDVPNLMTEFLQDSFALFDRSGPQNATTQNAYAGNLFGIPKNLPGDGNVPVNADYRSDKYTGLELYGYSLPWTTYLGEWDHIKTQSDARLLSNFGFFDKIELTGSAVGGSIANGLNVGVNNFQDELGKNGNIFKAIGGFYAGWFQGSAAGAIAPVLDSSDLNVLLSFAWYRVGYANTAYGLRQLTDAEIASSIRLSFVQILTQNNPADAVLGDDFMSVAAGAGTPRKPVSKCEVLSVDVNSSGEANTGSWVEKGKPSEDQLKNSNYTGVSREDCEAQAASSLQKWKDADSRGKAPGDGGKTLADFTRYDADGNRKKDTVATWKEWNADLLNTAAGLGIDCSSTYPNDSVPADSIYTDYTNCWGGSAPGGPGTGYTGKSDAGDDYAWNKAANGKYEATQTTINTDWIANTLSQVMVQAFLQKNQATMNFNAPWRRYVCTNADGSDMKTASGDFVYAFNVDGNVNPACDKVFRAPIQNGLFGNGYTGGPNQSPKNDTRHISNFGDPVGIIIVGTLTEFSTQVQGFMLGIGQLATELSSEVISWTYSPILDSLGITSIISKLIKGFRDSIFFPLAFMLVAAAAIQILFRAFRSQAYREGFVSVLMICLVFISGSVMMYNTDATINFVQKAPAVVEQAVVGTIFKASSVGNDELCTSTSARVNTSGNIFGKLAQTSSKQSTRELICNNWRVFTFTPWVYGQFGADFNKLYANGAKGLPEGSSTWKNTNQSLVGNASVNMGNGVVVKNWALYQLDVLKSGTATTPDTSIKNGRVDPNFYRIVDAQYGPDNGAGTENRYSSAWSGSNQAQRYEIAVLSPVLAVLGSAVVIAYSITKIVVTAVSTLMLVFLPFAFLLGLFPSKRSRLKDYLMAIVGMMIQRIALIVVLSVFFVMLLTFAGAGSGNYFNSFLMGLIICGLFWSWRKSIMGYVFSSIGNPQFGSSWRQNPTQAMKEWPILKTAAQGIDQLREARTSIGSAALGSVISGRAPVSLKRDEDGNLKLSGTVTEELRSRSRVLFRVQRRNEGFEGVASGIATAREVAEATRTKATLDEDTQKLIGELLTGSDEDTSAEAELKRKRDLYEQVKNLPGYREISVPVMENDVPVRDASGQQVYKEVIVHDDNPEEELFTKPKDELDNYGRLTSPQDRRMVQQYRDLQKKTFDNRRNKLQLREQLMNDPDPRVRAAFDKYTATDATDTLREFHNETDLRAKAKLSKSLDKDFKGELDEILAKVDSDLPDSEGFTAGDRTKIKKLIARVAKENLEQDKNEYQMERIGAHLRKVAELEYIAGNQHDAAKKTIADMKDRVNKAAQDQNSDEDRG